MGRKPKFKLRHYPNDLSASRRRHSVGVKIGTVTIGGGAPIVVQSMTNTDTEDEVATAIQVAQLALVGSELVRITVNTPEAARMVAPIRDRLAKMGCDVPLIGDFHYNGHKLLTEYPDCAEALAKYRINPGNVGHGKKRDEQFATMIKVACNFGKPVRIGVNWGSLDSDLLTRLMDENAARAEPLPTEAVMHEAMITSALESAAKAEEIGLPRDNIGISLPGSGERPVAPVFVDGEKTVTLRGAGITEEFKQIVDTYVQTRYAKR